MLSKQANDEFGVNYNWGSVERLNQKTGCPDGTIIVRDLFYNVQFMKKMLQRRMQFPLYCKAFTFPS